MAAGLASHDAPPNVGALARCFDVNRLLPASQGAGVGLFDVFGVRPRHKIDIKYMPIHISYFSTLSLYLEIVQQGNECWCTCTMSCLLPREEEWGSFDVFGGRSQDKVDIKYMPIHISNFSTLSLYLEIVQQEN